MHTANRDPRMREMWHSTTSSHLEVSEALGKKT